MTSREMRDAVADVLRYEIDHAWQCAGDDAGAANSMILAALRMADAIAPDHRGEFYARCGLRAADVYACAERPEQSVAPDARRTGPDQSGAIAACQAYRLTGRR